MTTMQKAYRIRNLYNTWKDQSKKEAVVYERLSKLNKELEKATYSKNGYEHFRTLSSWLNREEAERQKAGLIRNREKAINRMKELEAEIEQLLTQKEP